MSPLGWIFMLGSVAFVTVLLSWCYYKVLTNPEDRSDPDAND